MNYTILVVEGAVAGLLTTLLVQKFAHDRYREILTILLVFIAAIYVGPVVGATGSTDYLETAVATGLLILGVFALRGSLVLLATGYFLHGAWDALHGVVVPHILPHWYAPVCIGFDFAVAMHILFQYQLGMHRADHGR